MCSRLMGVLRVTPVEGGVSRGWGQAGAPTRVASADRRELLLL